MTITTAIPAMFSLICALVLIIRYYRQVKAARLTANQSNVQLAYPDTDPYTFDESYCRPYLWKDEDHHPDARTIAIEFAYGSFVHLTTGPGTIFDPMRLDGGDSALHSHLAQYKSDNITWK